MALTPQSLADTLKNGLKAAKEASEKLESITGKPFDFSTVKFGTKTEEDTEKPTNSIYTRK